MSSKYPFFLDFFVSISVCISVTGCIFFNGDAERDGEGDDDPDGERDGGGGDGDGVYDNEYI
jgi:hypothetical protein